MNNSPDKDTFRKLACSCSEQVKNALEDLITLAKCFICVTWYKCLKDIEEIVVQIIIKKTGLKKE